MRENTGIVPHTKICSRDFSRSSKRTVRASITTTRSIAATVVWYEGVASLDSSMAWLWRTSSAVTASPLLKRACGWMRKLTAEKSGATNIASASSPYIVEGSSCPRCARPSTIQIMMPAGELPRTVQGLNLSKLVRRSGFFSLMVPPLGASGLTYSKCVNSGPYFGVP